MAYYSSLCWPAANSEEEDHASVSIQWDDETWEEIFRVTIDDNYVNEDIFSQMAEAILTHYLGTKPSIEQIKKLMHTPGETIMRVTPNQLIPFKQMRLF